jgi:hypothetical protein
MTPATETLRPELTPLPERLKALPVYRGYPVPWFVAWHDGEPEFRAADFRKWAEAVRYRLCWVCGGKLGSYLAFVLGPMCGITRTTSEPACHRECAGWSVLNCPFLVRPHMVRREDGMEDAADPPGCLIRRNPGVALVWVSRSFEIFYDQNRRLLLKVGDPLAIECYAEGRKAKPEEIAHSIAGGLPKLMEIAQAEGPAAVADLKRQADEFRRLLGGSE